MIAKKNCEEKAYNLLLLAETSFNETEKISDDILQSTSTLCSSNHAGPIIALKGAIDAHRKAKIQTFDFAPKEDKAKVQSVKAKEKEMEIKKMKLED